MTDKQIIHGEQVPLITLTRQQLEEDWFTLWELYKTKEQECEGLKEEIKNHNDDMFKNPPEKRFYCKGCTLPYISKKLKQTLTEIKEIASHYNDMSGNCVIVNFFEDMCKILQKISECEAEDNGK